MPALLIGALLGVATLTAGLMLHERSAAESGLGINTTSGVTPHDTLGAFEFDSPAGLTLDRIMTTRGLPRRTLWLGASQLYGINDRKPKDRTVAYRVFSVLAAEGVDLGVIGLPNGTPREHLILLASLAPRVEPDLLIVGAVYDDMRHPEIRPSLDMAAGQSPARDVLARYTAGREILASRNQPEGPSTAQQTIRRKESWTQRSEAWLTATLEDTFGFTTARKKGRGLVVLTLLELRRFFELQRFRWTRDLSNYRVQIQLESYRGNLTAWEAMLELAERRGIAVLIYIAPRPADFFPYDPEGYAAYKRDLHRLAKRYGARLLSIEDAVPPQYWGEVDITFGFPVRDPFHFKNAGHELMAKALLPEIQRALQDGR
ncbi:MAG: hypothetical protein GKS00_09525 [Alphaproteobacteria bacterium]|nr:hypothetical protein [Alphaproteobacteria bacterium]